MHAVSELQTTYVTHQLCWQEHISSWRKENPSEDELEEAQVRAEPVQKLAAGLYVL